MTRFIVFSSVLHIIIIIMSFGTEKARAFEEKKEAIAIELFESDIKEDFPPPVLEKK